MPKLQLTSLLAFFFCTVFSFAQQPERINWVSFEKATELNKTAPRKIFVDLYTDWCGWCKKMDKTSFEDSAVVRYMNTNYYAVKFNTERCDTIRFHDRVFTCQPGNRTNDLAMALMNNKLDGYPSSVYINEKGEILSYYSGFIPSNDLLKILRYFGDNQHLSTSWEEYQKR